VYGSQDLGALCEDGVNSRQLAVSCKERVMSPEKEQRGRYNCFHLAPDGRKCMSAGAEIKDRDISIGHVFPSKRLQSMLDGAFAVCRQA